MHDVGLQKSEAEHTWSWVVRVQRRASMKRWSEFAAEQPDMAEAGRALIYQFHVGLGYLTTVRKDGGPRVHPVCLVIAHGGLYVFIGNHSPKVHDLRRGGGFA